MLQEFKKFIFKGNILDLAVGVIMGSSFGAIVASLVNDIIMPPIGLLLGGINFDNLLWVIKAGDPLPPYATSADAAAAKAVSINYGHFINLVITFLIIALVVFLLLKSVHKMLDATKKPVEAAAPTTKECPFCASTIPLKATRCPHCTSQL